MSSPSTKRLKSRSTPVRRRRRARPTPKWIRTRQDLDEVARRRCLMVLRVLSGEVPVTEVIAEAQISRGTYYSLEDRALRAMIAALAPSAASTTDETGVSIAESPAKLRAKLLQHFSALLGRGDFAPVACNAPWVSSVIEADGTVRPCFFHEPLGNVREAGSLSAVLNSEKARAFRSGLDVSTNPICRRCVCSLHYEKERGLTGAASMIAGREPVSP